MDSLFYSTKILLKGQFGQNIKIGSDIYEYVLKYNMHSYKTEHEKKYLKLTLQFIKMW